MTALQHLRKRLEPQLRWGFHLYWRVARGMTLGVRGVVLDGDDKVFLVRHSYVAGWHLPGGGVEVGETFLEALARELMEEGRIELTGEPVLHGLFFNGHVARRDHVARRAALVNAVVGDEVRLAERARAAHIDQGVADLV